MENEFAVVAKDVKKYYGKVKALDGVSIGVKRGQIFALLGPNGAGKTTLVKAMTTLLKPESGTVTVNGIDTSISPELVRPQIGLAGQFASVDEFLTGRENIHMVGRLYHLDRKTVKQRTTDLLKQFGLTEAADRPVKTYSGGMRRRIDLAASIISRPEILFLDEPTTGLDPRTRLEMWDVINGLVEAGTTILLTTQYLEEADELADYIAVIDNGKLISQGTADELKSQLGGDVVELTINREEDPAKVLKAVKSVAKKKPTFNEKSRRVSVPVVEGSKSLLNIVRALVDANIVPEEISLHRPSLDDVFLSLTGGKPKSKNLIAKKRSKK